MGKKMCSWNFLYLFFKIKLCNLRIPKPPHRTSKSKLKEKPSALKRAFCPESGSETQAIASNGGEGMGAIREYWWFLEDQAFSPSYDLDPSPSPLSRQQVVAVFLCVVAGRDYRRENGGGGGELGRSQNKKNLINYIWPGSIVVVLFWS